MQSDILDDSTATKYDILSLSPPVHKKNKHQRNQFVSSTIRTNDGGGTSTGLSFSNPVYELSNPTAGESSLDCLSKSTESLPTTTAPHVAFKVEHVLAPNCATSNRFESFRIGLNSRWRVAHAIYPYMVCIALAYCVTLSLYPGIEAEIRSCKLLTWMPVLLMFTFNTSDVVGKVMASFPYTWSRRQLILLSSIRIALVPLLLLCCAPRAQPIISGETSPFIFTTALGVTNGLAGSLPMMLAPDKVPATLKEVTGNMMTLSYNIGLTAGSLIGYVFDSMLGPPIDKPCPRFPYAPMSPYAFNSTPATILTTATIPTTVATMTTTTTTTAVVTTILSTILELTTPTTTPRSMQRVTIATPFVSNHTSTVASIVSTAVTSIVNAVDTVPSTKSAKLATNLAKNLVTTLSPNSSLH